MFGLIVVAIATFAVSASAEWVRMESDVNKFTSSRWLKENTIKAHDVVKAIFVLKHDDATMKAFDKKLMDVSNPKSANYGKWLNHDEIKALFSPSDAKVKVVTDYIDSFGIKSSSYKVSKLNDMVHVEMPVAIANKMLNTEFAIFRSSLANEVILPRITQPYYLPEEVANVVSIVDDILRFPAIRRTKFTEVKADASADAAWNSCGTSNAAYTNPAVLKSAYSVSVAATPAKGNSVSVAEFQNQYYDAADLAKFSSQCGVSVSVDTTIGGNNPTICNIGCVEALLDIEYIGALTYPIPLTVIYSSTYSLFDWANQINTLANSPLVHSVSYGNDEIQQTSTAYMNSVNAQFLTSGTLGLSILFASGDQGVWGRSGVGSRYNPDFPAASPYVTAVGGTNFQTKGVIGAESTWSCGGGGFSDTFAQPDWQASAVSAYLTAATKAGVLPSTTYFNTTGRAYPDVAALGGQTNPYLVAVHGGALFEGVAGTSASSPVVAGIFAQLNDVRLKAGKSSLGFLNPLIYQNPSCFNDVSDGTSNYCNSGTTGFAALSGWDPATGHGSPNYACLAKVV
jgi:tripeptidyl-peptidase-1